MFTTESLEEEIELYQKWWLFTKMFVNMSETEHEFAATFKDEWIELMRLYSAGEYKQAARLYQILTKNNQQLQDNQFGVALFKEMEVYIAADEAAAAIANGQADLAMEKYQQALVLRDELLNLDLGLIDDQQIIWLKYLDLAALGQEIDSLSHADGMGISLILDRKTSFGLGLFCNPNTILAYSSC